MPPKAERIELRLEVEAVEAVDRWRAEQVDLPSRSEAMRRLIEHGLTSHDRGPFYMSRGEALTNWMLAEILKQQRGAEGQQLGQQVQDVIQGGHYWALDWEHPGIMHGSVDNYTDVKFVLNCMDMWSFIERAYERLGPESRQTLEEEAGFRGKDPRFIGFDGNNEALLMSTARFMVEKLDRFQGFKGRDFNSHLPRVDVYRAMLAEFEPIRKTLVGREMSADELVRVLKLDD